MKKGLSKRFLAIILCLLLFPLGSPAETLSVPEADDEIFDAAILPEDMEEDEEEQMTAEDEPAQPKAVFHSNFSLDFQPHADGFPKSTPRLQDWETFLRKLSLRGYVNAMDYLNPYSRVYVDAGLYIRDDLRLPFIYDAYHSYRYLISPAIKNESLHFQMHNFFEFMLKPYYYMGLPTQYLALLMYPEAFYYMAESYYTPVAEVLAGDGTRTISHEELYELAETLDLPILDDPHYLRAEFFFIALLADLSASEMVIEKFGDFETLLDFLDPDQKGMTITATGNQQTYVLGDTTVFHKKQVSDSLTWTATIPDPDGYLSSLSFAWTPTVEGGTLALLLNISQDNEEKIKIELNGSGLPCEGDTNGEGLVTLTLSGSSLANETTQRFAFQWDTDSAELPNHLDASIDWLHPETGKTAFSVHYTADQKEVSETAFVQGTYPQIDFFNLNDSSLEEYKERYFPTLVLALAPLALEMPAGVINDLYAFFAETGILSSLGL